MRDTRVGLEDIVKATGRKHAVCRRIQTTGAENRTVITVRREVERNTGSVQ